VQFYHRSGGSIGKRVGVLPGSFNPPTIAHIELAHAAAAHVDEVVCVLPRVFPHKEYFGASLEERVELLRAVGLAVPHSIAVSEQGLFIDIARECREHYGEQTTLYFLCGRDAAERIMTWDYGRAGVVEEMLAEFQLLVAPRGGQFRPPGKLRHRVHELNLGDEHGDVSSTEVRERIAIGESWEHLVPKPIAQRVREIYS
jgi:nicotinate (nicotinamide) nucleotide adenylyltransferase